MLNFEELSPTEPEQGIKTLAIKSEARVWTSCDDGNATRSIFIRIIYSEDTRGCWARQDDRDLYYIGAHVQTHVYIYFAAYKYKSVYFFARL